MGRESTRNPHIVRERVGAEIFPQRRRPPGEFQRVEASSDMVKDFADDRGLGDEPHDAHPFAATAQKRVDLVDAADEARPRFPAGRKPGTVGSRRIGRLVLRRDLDEDLAPKCDSAVGVRAGTVIVDEGILGMAIQKKVVVAKCDPLSSAGRRSTQSSLERSGVEPDFAAPVFGVSEIAGAIGIAGCPFPLEEKREYDPCWRIFFRPRCGMLC